MKTIHPAIAEHALSRVSELEAENEKLRGLLGEVRVLLANSSYKISGTAAFLHSIDAALSQRAEPEECLHEFVPFRSGCTKCGQSYAEPAPAQDEREAHVPDKVFQDEFQVWWEDHGQFCRAGGGDYERTFAFQAWRHLYPMLLQARATHPAQTEQQPLAVVPQGLPELLESVRLSDEEAKPHGPGATYWNNAVFACQVAIRDALCAAPIAQPAPQPEPLDQRMLDHFTCRRVDNAGGTPGYTLYFTKMGAHHEYQLYRNEAAALHANLGKALSDQGGE